MVLSVDLATESAERLTAERALQVVAFFSFAYESAAFWAKLNVFAAYYMKVLLLFEFSATLS